MNRETLRHAWLLHNVHDRRAQEHLARCVVPDERRDEGYAPTVCPECVALYHFALGLSMGLDLLNPGQRRYAPAQLFWDDDEESFLKQ